MTPPFSHHADYSPERRATAISWIRGEGLLDHQGISEQARLLAVVGLLICDDTGHIKKEHLDSAMTDESVIQTATAILREARTCP